MIDKMVIEIVHSAIARKMLCNPINSLIADTELVCAAGVMVRALNCKREEAEYMAALSDTEEMQHRLAAILSGQISTELEEPYQNLAKMIKEYRGTKAPLIQEYRELFWYGYEKPLKFPKMNNV